jgi:hypothetical protein
MGLEVAFYGFSSHFIPLSGDTSGVAQNLSRGKIAFEKEKNRALRWGPTPGVGEDYEYRR